MAPTPAFTVVTCAAPIVVPTRHPRTAIPGTSRPTAAATATTVSPPGGNRHYFTETLKRQALDIYTEGTGITATGRAPGLKSAMSFPRQITRQTWDLMGQITWL